MRHGGVLAAERRLAKESDGRGWARDIVERLCLDRVGRLLEFCDEVGLAAEQPEPVLDFPLDARRTGGFCFRAGNVAAATRKHDEKGEDENRKHSVCRHQPRAMISM